VQQEVDTSEQAESPGAGLVDGIKKNQPVAGLATLTIILMSYLLATGVLEIIVAVQPSYTTSSSVSFIAFSFLAFGFIAFGFITFATIFLFALALVIAKSTFFLAAVLFVIAIILPIVASIFTPVISNNYVCAAVRVCSVVNVSARRYGVAQDSEYT